MTGEGGKDICDVTHLKKLFIIFIYRKLTLGVMLHLIECNSVFRQKMSLRVVHIHTHTHTYIHACIHTCMHTYILTCIHIGIYT